MAFCAAALELAKERDTFSLLLRCSKRQHGATLYYRKLSIASRHLALACVMADDAAVEPGPKIVALNRAQRLLRAAFCEVECLIAQSYFMPFALVALASTARLATLAAHAAIVLSASMAEGERAVFDRKTWLVGGSAVDAQPLLQPIAGPRAIRNDTRMPAPEPVSLDLLATAGIHAGASAIKRNASAPADARGPDDSGRPTCDDEDLGVASKPELMSRPHEPSTLRVVDASTALPLIASQFAAAAALAPFVQQAAESAIEHRKDEDEEALDRARGDCATDAYDFVVDTVAEASPHPQPTRAPELCDCVSPGALAPLPHAVCTVTNDVVSGEDSLRAVLGPRATRVAVLALPRRAPTSGRSLLRLLAHGRLRGYQRARLLAWRKSNGQR